MFLFLKYGLVSPIYIDINIITSYFFYTTKKIFKTIYVLACILAWITSLFKPWELGQDFKNSKRSFRFLLVFGITNLYVKRIPKYYLFGIDVRTVKFLPDKIKDLLTEEDFSWTIDRPTTRRTINTIVFIRQ